MALFSRLKLKVQFALSKKVIISEARCRFTIEGRRGGKAWIIGSCVQRLAKIGGLSGGMGVGSRKSFGDDACRIRGMFLETNGVFRKKNFFNDKRLKKKLFISMNTICSSAKVRMN